MPLQPPNWHVIISALNHKQTKYDSIYIYIRAVSVNALIYAINAAAINAIKYFNAIKKKYILFFIFYFFCNAFFWIGHEVMTGSEAENRWGENWEMTSGQTKLKLYVAFVKLNLAITEAARLEVITLMQSTRQKAVPGEMIANPHSMTSLGK